MTRDLRGRLGAEEDSGRTWVVFSDVALAMLFVFLIYIFAQFVHYQKIAVWDELQRRQAAIKTLLQEELPEEFERGLRVDSIGGFAQRVTFPSDLLFATCSDDVRATGRTLVVRVGAVLAPRSAFFEAIEVEGHTDARQPSGPECPFRDNWELSSRRAATVVRELAGGAGLEPEILSSVGKGEFRLKSGFGSDRLPPVETRDSLLAADRRIEVLLQYSENDIRDSLRAK